MTKVLKSTTLAVAITAVASMTITPIAANAQSVSGQKSTTSAVTPIMENPVSDNLQKKADPYIELQGDQFQVLPTAKQALTEGELAEVKQAVHQTNEAISSAELDAGDTKVTGERSVTFTSPAPTTPGEISTFAAGKNGIEFHWGRVEVYISQGTIQTMGAGVSIAGIWFSAWFIDEVLSTLGVVAATVPHGIVITTNYGDLLSALREFRMPNVWSVAWQ